MGGFEDVGQAWCCHPGQEERRREEEEQAAKAADENPGLFLSCMAYEPALILRTDF